MDANLKKYFEKGVLRGDKILILPIVDKMICNMKIIYNHLLPFGERYYAINLFGVLFAKGPVDREMLNHEEIHTAQMKEMGYLLFYLWYVVEWLWRLIQKGDSFKAYHAISFEREAYANERNYSYLPRRKKYAWRKYL